MSSRQHTPPKGPQKLTLSNPALCVFNSIVAIAGTPVSPARISPPNPLLFLLLWTFFSTLAPDVSSGSSRFTRSSSAGKGSVFSIVAVALCSSAASQSILGTTEVLQEKKKGVVV